MRSTLPRATVLHTNAAYTRSGAGLSAAYTRLAGHLEPAVHPRHRLPRDKRGGQWPGHGSPATVASCRSTVRLHQFHLEPVLRQRFRAVGGMRRRVAPQVGARGPADQGLLDRGQPPRHRRRHRRPRPGPHAPCPPAMSSATAADASANS